MLMPRIQRTSKVVYSTIDQLIDVNVLMLMPNIQRNLAGTRPVACNILISPRKKTLWRKMVLK
jgi:hypothetical protein